MTAKKPSRPWRLILLTPGGPITKPFTFERGTYAEVRAEKQRIANGISRVTRIRVEKWSADYGRWDLIDIAYPED